MRSISALLFLSLFLGCEPAAREPATPPGPTLADFAGTWQSMATLNGVENPVPSTMSGSASGTDWTMQLEGRDPVHMQVSIVGDSLIAQTDEYESVLRAGVMVNVRTASVLQNGMLMGNLVATYKTPTGNEVVTGTIHGNRVP